MNDVSTRYLRPDGFVAVKGADLPEGQDRCDSCDWRTKFLHKVKIDIPRHRSGFAPNDNGDRYICVVCFSTHAADALLYGPHAGIEHAKTMQMMAWTANYHAWLITGHR